MPSIYQKALGSDFEKLHPKIQKRFGFDSSNGIASIGTGIMDEVWRGRAFTVPFLYLGSWRRIMFPEYGRDVPFTIENYAYRDSLDRETVTWIRTFQSRKQRRFDAYMVFNEQRGCIVDYLGTHQHLAVDLDLSVDSRGGMSIRSGLQRFHEGFISFKFPMSMSGFAEVLEWYDDDNETYRIEVEVVNRRWGRLFGYRGAFHVVWKDIQPDQIPTSIKPRREERRG